MAAGKKAKLFSPLMPCRIKFRTMVSTGTSTVVVVGHLHREAAKKNCDTRKRFFDELARLCVGGARLFGADANMAVFGILPEMAQRGVEMHLCCIHAEYSPPAGAWKWDSLGIWAVGPMPDPGQAMSIETHALTALCHPRLADTPAKNLLRGFTVNSYKDDVPDPETFVDEDMVAWYEWLESNCKTFASKKQLAPHIKEKTWCPVVAFKDRYNDDFELPKHDKLNIKEVPWRCPQAGKGTQGFPGTDHLPPLPPMNEVMADSLKWDPLGHRWGRGAHWPLILGVGHRRERTPAQKQKRAAHRREKKGYSRTSALAEDPYPSSSAAAWRPNCGQADTYWEQHQGWYSGASGSGSWHTEARWEQRPHR